MAVTTSVMTNWQLEEQISTTAQIPVNFLHNHLCILIMVLVVQ